jgi:hypothetical protein
VVVRNVYILGHCVAPHLLDTPSSQTPAWAFYQPHPSNEQQRGQRVFKTRLRRKQVYWQLTVPSQTLHIAGSNNRLRPAVDINRRDAPRDLIRVNCGKIGAKHTISVSRPIRAHSYPVAVPHSYVLWSKVPSLCSKLFQMYRVTSGKLSYLRQFHLTVVRCIWCTKTLSTDNFLCHGRFTQLVKTPETDN